MSHLFVKELERDVVRWLGSLTSLYVAFVVAEQNGLFRALGQLTA